MAYVYRRNINWRQLAPISLCLVVLLGSTIGNIIKNGLYVYLLFLLLFFAGIPIYISRLRIVIDSQGLRFSPVRNAGMLRSFDWSELRTIQRQMLALTGKKVPVLKITLASGHSFPLVLADADGRPFWGPLDVAVTPPLAEGIGHFLHQPIADGGEASLRSVQTDLGREAGHVAAAALGFAGAAVVLMVVSGQHYFNSVEYTPYLMVFSLMAGVAAVRYQWRLARRINMVLPTMLVMATAAWFAWAGLLELAATVGRPVTADFLAESAEEAGTTSLESGQYWRSRDPRLPAGDSGILMLWADPGHFRYGLGKSVQLNVRVIPLLGIATIGHSNYMAMLKPLSQLHADPVAPKSLPAAEGIVAAPAATQ